MTYRVMTDQGGGHHYVYLGDSLVEAVEAFQHCMPPDVKGVLLDYDAHLTTGDPAIAMHHPVTGKTLAVLHGVTWEQWEELIDAPLHG